MLKVYAKIQVCLQILFMLGAVCMLGGCAEKTYPWEAPVNTGIVTDNPDSMPDIRWQTTGQRQELIDQDNETAAQQEMPIAETPLVEAIAIPARKITVALLLPLSGKKSDLGQSMLKAAQMAMFDVGSADFELVPRDTKGTTAGAEAAARAAVNANSDLVLGPVFADDLKAVQPILAAAGTPVISFTTDWTLTGNNTYIMGFLPFAQVSRVAKYAQARGYSRFAVYAPQTKYCDAVIQTLQNSGVEITRIERYAAKQSDLATLVADFAATSMTANHSFDFNALMLPLGSEGLRTLVTALEASGIEQTKIKFIGTGLWDDAVLTTDPALFGGWFAAPDPTLRSDFEARYRENFGSSPARLASLAYDATALAAVLARSFNGPGSPYGRDILTNPRGFAGIDGVFRFRPDGLSERGLAVLEIRSGKAVVIDPAPTAFMPSGS